MVKDMLGGRYAIDGIIGHGEVAEVFRAHDIRLGRIVAVKTIRNDLPRSPTLQARFREVQSAARLNHPAIVAVYDTGEDTVGFTRVPYVVMEYVDGLTLRNLLQDDRRLLPDRALEITDGVLSALDYSHRAGIVHRDIKPSNVMLRRGGGVKVMDFGIVQTVSDHEPVTTDPEMVLDRAPYLSPEQARGAQVDARSDLYSTGCLLYELLTGRAPFLGDSPVAVAYQAGGVSLSKVALTKSAPTVSLSKQVGGQADRGASGHRRVWRDLQRLRENPVPPSRIDPEIPSWADPIVLRAMAKDPSDRYQSAAEMRAAVQRALAVPRMGGSPYGERTPTPPQLGSPMAPVSPRYPPPAVTPASAPTAGPDRVPTVVPNPAVVIKKPIITGVTETSRRHEPLHKQEFNFNNKNSSAETEETIRVSYTSRVSQSVDLGETRALSGNASVGFVNLAGAQTSLGKELTRHYSLRLDDELTYEQTTKVTVPAGKRIQLTLQWFRIWASGMLTLSEDARRAVEDVAEVPYEITVALTYDPETRDI